MAAGLHAPWEAVYVEASTQPMSDGDRDRLEAHLELVESLGGPTRGSSAPRSRTRS